MAPEPPSPRSIKTPPLLLGAGLLFWGWQSGMLVAGAVMAIILEGARFARVRWDLSETDFRRIWNFCTILSLAVGLYAFTANEGPGGFGSLVHGPAAFRNATATGVRTATAFLRWLPLISFLAVAAQVYGVRENMPLTAISPWLRYRRRQELKSGQPVSPIPHINITYPFFMVCIFSAGIHPNEGNDSFFWGQTLLFAWALWPLRSQRFTLVIWGMVFLLVVTSGFYTQSGIRGLQVILEQYNARWMTRFFHAPTDPTQSTTAIGQIGELKLSGQIAIRLHTQNQSPPPYLREASYRGYSSQQRRWYVSSGNRAAFENGTIYPETNQTTFVLLPGKTNTAAVNIACYLWDRTRGGNSSGLLPLPMGCGRLENLNAYILGKNPEGAVLVVEGPGLVIFDALYGPGATIDAAPFPYSRTNLDYSVPTNEIAALDDVISENHLSGRTDRETMQKVYEFFSKNFTYSTWQGLDKLGTNGTPISRFLLSSRSGHCEYFATATVLLLRELKIPARYAVGYAVHESAGAGSYVVRDRDAHAWCLAWDAETKTWEDFDTTPGVWVDVEGKRASAWERLSDLKSWLGFQISRLRWGQTHLRDYILWAAIPVLVLLLYQIIFRHGRRQQRLKRSNYLEHFSWPGLDSEFYRLETKLARRGIVRGAGEPLSDWLARALADSTLADQRAPLLELLRLHYRYRFDPQGLDPAERKRLTVEAKSCLEKLSGA